MWVICGSHPDCSVGQWLKWVNRCDPLSTLIIIYAAPVFLDIVMLTWFYVASTICNFVQQLASYMHCSFKYEVLQCFCSVTTKPSLFHSYCTPMHKCNLLYSNLASYCVNSNCHCIGLFLITFVISVLMTLSYEQHYVFHNTV